jgi:hypothetical protein
LQRDPKDVIVSNFLRDNQARVEAIFDAALRRAQKEGELSAKEDTAALARLFVVTIQGMRTMARLQSDRKALEQVARRARRVRLTLAKIILDVDFPTMLRCPARRAPASLRTWPFEVPARASRCRV